MKAVILAGGMQSTINDSYEGIPKPMAEIGEKPILWHIMKYLDAYGISDFIICGGYKVNMLKDYFHDYYLYASDITVDLKNNTVECHRKQTEDWSVTVVDTGLNASVAKRILQVEDHIGADDFLVVTGDTVSDLDVRKLIAFHKDHGRTMTLAVARPTGRSEMLPIDENGYFMDENAAALPQNQAWTDMGTRVFTKGIFAYLKQDYEMETSLYRKLAEDNGLISYFHDGFWLAMETRRDKVNLERLWETQTAPWRIF
ncbi:MAG: NTP transferase domain-containing protein [Lachnospiraceae bacterium]|nr:NTP transferase domain-containing protein [Lachnospiraceae bacterium]